MPSQSIAHVFIDANTALHFKRPNEIDWQLLTGTGAIVLVAAPILLRELEKQKIFNPSRKLRERAATYVRWLHSFLINPDSEVRPGARWLFLSVEPTIDFAAARLSPNISEDHLIASVLDYTPEPPGALFVATADIGLEAKLRARGIAILALPDGVRLPPEPDPVEQENRALRQQIARIEARMPKLSVAFSSGAQHHAIHPLDVPLLAQIKAKQPLMVKRGNKPSLRDDLAVPLANVQHLLGISGTE